MKAVLFLLLAAVSACTHASVASPRLSLWPQVHKGRITGGSDATRNQFPYQVSLQWLDPDVFLHACGGSILSPNYVLTAGHCITLSPGLGRTRVVAGILDIEEDGVVVEIASALVHPDYEGDIGPNNLAVIRLANTLSFSESIRPISLPAPDTEPEGRAVFSGWGSTSTGFIPDFPAILQYVYVPILTNDECADALTALLGVSGILQPSNVCTGPLNEGISTCTADSGGPLVQQNELIGVSAWGVSPCGYEGAPSVYTKVSSFIDFIRENVPDLPDSKQSHLE